jgi:hypothetical protein
MQDRRGIIRNRTYYGGKIIFNDRNSVMDCLVRNFSPGGAKLVLSATVTLPQIFDMSISKQGSKRARTVWRREDEMGVAFVEQPRSENVVDLDAVRRLRES